MEKKMENEMETREYIGFILGLYWVYIGVIFGLRVESLGFRV